MQSIYVEKTSSYDSANTDGATGPTIPLDHISLSDIQHQEESLIISLDKNVVSHVAIVTVQNTGLKKSLSILSNEEDRTNMATGIINHTSTLNTQALEVKPSEVTIDVEEHLEPCSDGLGSPVFHTLTVSEGAFLPNTINDDASKQLRETIADGATNHHPDRGEVSSIAKPSSVQQQQQVSSVPKAATKDYELQKFGLSVQDKVLESFSCALYPKKGLLSHGRMFITQHFVAFSSWKDMRVLLPMRKVCKVEKTNTLLYIPNALCLLMEDKAEYFFGSFIDRDACVHLLLNLVEIERRIIEIHGIDTSLRARDRELEFGYQTRQPSRVLLSGNVTGSLQSFLMGGAQHDPAAPLVAGARWASATSTGPAAAAAASLVRPDDSAPLPHDLETAAPAAAASGVALESPPGSPCAQATQCVPVSGGLPAATSAEVADADAASQPSAGASISPAPSIDTAAGVAATGPAVAWSSCIPSKPSPSSAPPFLERTLPSPGSGSSSSSAGGRADALLSALSNNTSIQWLLKQRLACSMQHFWKSCWLYSCGYGDFLRDEGALELKYSEWSRIASSGAASSDSALPRVVEEDSHSKLPFAFSRDFTYAFPRTTMLMFGPKFAPIKQTQYLFLPQQEQTEEQQAALNSLEALEALQPQQLAVLFVTKFEGIPMADVFKVLQYWVFSSDASSGELSVQVGVAIHYVKSSLFKSQILSGTKDELGAQVGKYVQYAQARGAEFKRTLEQQEEEQALRAEAARRRPGSLRRMSGRLAEPEDALLASMARLDSKLSSALAKSSAASSLAAAPGELALFGGGVSALLQAWPCLVVAGLLLGLLLSQWYAIGAMQSRLEALERAWMDNRALLRDALQALGKQAAHRHLHPA
jgi:hypothetical protein